MRFYEKTECLQHCPFGSRIVGLVICNQCLSKNPQAVIAAYFTFGLFIGLAFHRKDIQKISKASIISAFCIGLLYLFLLSLTAPQFNAFRLILISDTSMLLLGLGLIEILFCGK